MGISAQEMIKRLQTITESELQKKAKDLIEQDKGRNLRKAKINELEFGLNPDRTKIGSYRSDDYAFKKNNKNPLAGFGNVDLILTGAWSNSLFPVVKSNRVIFDSSNSKHDDLLSKYGEGIASLNQNTFNRIAKANYQPELLKLIKKRIGQ